MSTAVFVHEVSKKFTTLGPGLNGRTSRLNMKAFGRAGVSCSAQVIAALYHVSFSVQEAEVFGVVGPAGSGKSTLIRLLATLLIPDSGELRIFGQDVIRQPRQVQRWINRVSVEASFFKKLSPVENLLNSARMYGFNGAEARKQAEELLIRLGLEQNAIHKPMEEMPRGSQQQVTIANTLLPRPRLLLLDEPTKGLDSQAKRNVWQVLRELRKEYGTTVLMTTRVMTEVDGLCDRVAILEGGRLVALDTPEGMKQQLLFREAQPMLQGMQELALKDD